VALTRFKKNYFLLLIALLFIASASSSLIMLKKSEDLLAWNERATGWALVQLVLLQQSYSHSLRQFQQGADVHEQLLEYYDLTWSAYNTLVEGTDDLAFASQETPIAHLKKHFAAFQAIDPLENTLSAQQIDLMLETLGSSYDYALHLLNTEFQGFSMQRHDRDSALLQVNHIIVISLLGLCLSGSLFLFIILRDRRRMTYFAYHDRLTRLKNRRALQEKITELQCDKVQFSTLLIDIDGFKAVNDEYGHDIGDKLLTHLAKEMSATCIKPNFVGRLGGDEFAIVCFTQASLDPKLKKLLAITSSPIVIDGYRCDVGLSIGISYSRPSHHSWVDVLKDADQAMYKAKGMGGNQFQIYDPS